MMNTISAIVGLLAVVAYAQYGQLLPLCPAQIAQHCAQYSAVVGACYDPSMVNAVPQCLTAEYYSHPCPTGVSTKCTTSTPTPSPVLIKDEKKDDDPFKQYYFPLIVVFLTVLIGSVAWFIQEQWKENRKQEKVVWYRGQNSPHLRGRTGYIKRATPATSSLDVCNCCPGDRVYVVEWHDRESGMILQVSEHPEQSLSWHDPAPTGTICSPNCSANCGQYYNDCGCYIL
jgi:hypothetical protein